MSGRSVAAVNLAPRSRMLSRAQRTSLGHNDAMLTEFGDRLAAKGAAASVAAAEAARCAGKPAADPLLDDLAGHPHAFVLAALGGQDVKARRFWRRAHRWDAAGVTDAAA